MHPSTLHGVGVIIKLYFAIFAAFKESMVGGVAWLDRRSWPANFPYPALH